jgi:photosystem II stability/assembly factor-like uncharacterized protein
MKTYIITAFYSVSILLSSSLVFCQTPVVAVITSGTKTSLRGLSVVNDNIIWVSGSGGTVGKSLNAGKKWNWMTVKGFENKEFRDIEAFDANTALIMLSDTVAYILKTTNGGETWKVVYENKTKGMFLDAMDFCDFANGVVVGDPVNNKIFLASTTDNGNTWNEVTTDLKRPRADTGEAFFAASGSNIRIFRDGSYFMASGGTKSRLITNRQAVLLPIVQGKESTGANSIDIFDNGDPKKPGRRMIIVGGDFNDPTSTKKTCVYSTDGGKSWEESKKPPHGYRSSVEYLSQKDILSCGLNGVDFSNDGGKTWKWISQESFHVCRIARNGSAVFLAGENGKIGKLVID